jgi:hypothetical protein
MQMKKLVDTLDATPNKRLYSSIIVDYNLNTSVCELVDNVLDIWVIDKREKKVTIDISLDQEQQTMIVTDNAGGVNYDNLQLIVGPGQTGNLPSDETIGIFGVGSKRAVVALAQDIIISTRFNNDKTYQINYDDPWLRDESWGLNVYQVDNIDEGTTKIELSKLRFKIDDEAEAKLKEHLGATYARFLTNKKITISVNKEPITPITFENWAYPPKYSPRNYSGQIKTEDGDVVEARIRAGLTLVSSPAAGEYGVYLYCNDRLITRANKSFDFGFTKGKVGFPHASISLTRSIVSLSGSAECMPWNSSKSDINPNNKVFLAFRNWLIEVLKDYASISRRFVGDWPNKVFKYTSGTIQDVEVQDFPSAKKSYLPPLPIGRPRYPARLKAVNKAISKEKPWTTGLYVSIAALDMILSQKFAQKNRIALILLDSTLEIAFKESLVNESETYYDDKKLNEIFSKRHLLKNEMKNSSATIIDDATWKILDFYHEQRNKLIHERATVNIPDDQIEDFQDKVQIILGKLFKLKFNC